MQIELSSNATTFICLAMEKKNAVLDYSLSNFHFYQKYGIIKEEFKAAIESIRKQIVGH